MLLLNIGLVSLEGRFGGGVPPKFCLLSMGARCLDTLLSLSLFGEFTSGKGGGGGTTTGSGGGTINGLVLLTINSQINLS